MGCDIHFYVEKKIDGIWQSADEWEDNEYSGLLVPKPYYDDRNYALFGILAGVRRSEVTPIVPPRGVPTDLSPEVQSAYTDWDCDGHTPTWLLLSELMAHDWTQGTKRTGFLSAHDYWNWKLGGKYSAFAEKRDPKSWSSGVSGPSVTHITSAEMDALLAPYKDDYHAADEIKSLYPNHYCPCPWEVPSYYAASGFLSETVPKLWKLAAGNYSDVRCVFWFDN